VTSVYLLVLLYELFIKAGRRIALIFNYFKKSQLKSTHSAVLADNIYTFPVLPNDAASDINSMAWNGELVCQ